MEQKKMRVLTVRINDDRERDAIKFVMKQSGCKRAAQAMLFACNAYQVLVERDTPLIQNLRLKHQEHSRQQQRLINSLMEENERLRRSIRKMTETVNDFQKSMSEIQDLIAKK